MRRLKTVGAAGALVGSALVGGTLISAALAAPSSSPGASTTLSVGDLGNLGVDNTYSDTYLDTLAKELGVDRADLGPAAVAAARAAIDAAEAAGDIDADRADALRSRLGELENPERMLLGHPFLLGGPGNGPGRGIRIFGLGDGSVVDAATSTLGIDRDALVRALRDGTSLEDLAAKQGVAYGTVKTAITDAASTELATAVDDGHLTQDQADAILQRLGTWLDNGGQPGDGFGFGFGMHRGMRGGPWGGAPHEGSGSSTDGGSTDSSST